MMFMDVVRYAELANDVQADLIGRQKAA